MDPSLTNSSRDGFSLILTQEYLTLVSQLGLLIFTVQWSVRLELFAIWRNSPRKTALNEKNVFLKVEHDIYYALGLSACLRMALKDKGTKMWPSPW